MAVLVSLDASAAFKLVSHNILKRKLRYLGWSHQAMELLESFLDGRSQMVEVNGHRSSTLQNGPYSCIQGGTLSGLIYSIFTLDQNDYTHEWVTAHTTMNDCTDPKTESYVDDTYGVIATGQKQHKVMIRKVYGYLNDMKSYYDANKLSSNCDKTTIYLPSNHKYLGNCNFFAKG